MASMERYTLGHHPSVLRTHSWRTVENSAAYLSPYLLAGCRVLDVGSGPGTITTDIAQRVFPGDVFGLDASESVTQQATQRAAGLGVDNAHFLAGSAYELPFEDNSFDIVHAHQVLQHLGDPVAALREMRRVTKPGGIVAARDVVYGSASWYPLLPGLDEWMRVYQELARSGGGEPNGGRFIKAWALEAGFTEVRATASVWGFSEPDEREWWGGAWAERASSSNWGPDAISQGIATETQIQQIADAWTAWVADPAGWYAMPHGEILAVA